MFGIGMPELAVILVVALIVLGPKRLPEVARQLGKAMAEFRRQTTGVMEEFQAQVAADEEAERRRAVTPPPGKPATQASAGQSVGTAATAAATPPKGESTS